MADPLSQRERSRVMSRIRGKDTKIEIRLRSELHRRGFRFRLHKAGLPGKPDIVLPKYGAVIFVNGCFWHAHGCSLSSMPSSNKEFWKKKIERTKQRDHEQVAALLDDGWRVLTVWECSTRGPDSMSIDDLGSLVEAWILSGDRTGEIDRLGADSLRE